MDLFINDFPELRSGVLHDFGKHQGKHHILIGLTEFPGLSFFRIENTVFPQIPE